MAVANVTDGGCTFRFADRVPERCICSVAYHKVLRNARLLVCCGNHICETCLNHWLRTQGKLKKCPNCRREKFTHVEDLSIRREISNLKIRCTNGEEGCTWVGTMSKLKTHLETENGCGFIEVHCTNKCKKQLKRQDLTDHLAQHCPLRQCKCQHCERRTLTKPSLRSIVTSVPATPWTVPTTVG